MVFALVVLSFLIIRIFTITVPTTKFGKVLDRKDAENILRGNVEIKTF
jgi:hypothetical protein